MAARARGRIEPAIRHATSQRGHTVCKRVRPDQCSRTLREARPEPTVKTEPVAAQREHTFHTSTARRPRQVVRIASLVALRAGRTGPDRTGSDSTRLTLTRRPPGRPTGSERSYSAPARGSPRVRCASTTAAKRPVLGRGSIPVSGWSDRARRRNVRRISAWLASEGTPRMAYRSSPRTIRFGLWASACDAAFHASVG